MARATGVVKVALRDSAGVDVSSGSFSARLWRNVGKWWVRYPASMHHVAGALAIGGAGAAGEPTIGLEPGRYELEIESFLYGSLRRVFEIGRNETRELAITTPRYRRVICFRFVDQQGNPVSHIGLPGFVPGSWKLSDVERPQPLNPVLQQPPTKPRDPGGISHEYSISCGSAVYARTDEGRYFVQVGAGQPARVRFSLGEPWGQSSYEVSSDFVGPEWEETVVTLTLRDDFEQWIGKQRLTLGAPGNRQLVDPPVSPPELDPFSAPVAKGWTRVIVRVPDNWPVRVESLCDGRIGYFDYSASHKVWWSVLQRHVPASVRVTDDAFYLGEWLPAPTDDEIGVVRIGPAPSPVTIGVNDLPPTLRAFAVFLDFDIGVVSDVPPSDPNRASHLFRGRGQEPYSDSPVEAPDHGHLLGRMHANPTTGLQSILRVGGRRLRDLQNGKQLTTRTRVSGQTRYALWPRETFGYQYKHSSSSGTKTDGPMLAPISVDSGWRVHEANGSLRDQLNSGSVQPFAASLLCLRVVGEIGEGLPWVSGAVHELAEDENALRVRRTILEQELQPIQPDDWQDYENKLSALLPSDRDGVSRLIGPVAASSLLDSDQRRWFAERGTWYDTTRPIHSEDHGYMLGQKLNLTPGKEYVLYLWSHSRDDLHPDARIVFRAGQGVTDLGAIRLPSYR